MTLDNELRRYITNFVQVSEDAYNACQETGMAETAAFWVGTKITLLHILLVVNNAPQDFDNGGNYDNL